LKVRYTNHAVRQINRALDYIADRLPRGAAAVRARIIDTVTMLEGHPYAGHPTSWLGARRLVLSPYPYLLEYRLVGDEIIVMRFRHSARRPI
jgi:addiction module RelE/StbE family toxin